MRIAKEYQQAHKKPEQNSNNNKCIVRLGRGLPNQQGRKRGISLSKGGSDIQEQSLGKNEVSRQKEQQLRLKDQKQTLISVRPKITNDQKIVSTSNYNNNGPRNKGYAQQHLVFPNPREELGQLKYLSGVKSQESMMTRISQQAIVDQGVSRLRQNPINNSPFIPIKVVQMNEVRSLSREQGMVRPNQHIVQNIPNVYINKPLINTQDTQVQVNTLRLKSQEPIEINLMRQNSPQQLIHTPKWLDETKQHLIQTTKNTQKVIPRESNPYNLSNLKLTKKNQDKLPSSVGLKQTIKYGKALQESQLSLESHSSKDSKSNKGMFSRTGLVSLWDANKVQSIVSLKQSREIKIQQSEIMHDYFNPPDSLLNKL